MEQVHTETKKVLPKRSIDPIQIRIQRFLRQNDSSG